MITYNHERFIAQAIEGVLIQETIFPIELIIGEDCSTDQTLKIVLRYQQNYPKIIRVIKSDKNTGWPQNIARVRVASRGQYVAFCEGDDYWTDPLKLKKQVDFLEENLDYGLIHTDFDEYQESKDVLSKAFNITNNIKIPEGNIFNGLLNEGWIIHTPTTMVRGYLLKQYYNFLCDNETETKNWRYGDLPLFLYCALFSKIKYLDGSTAVYRILHKSLCHSKSEKKTIENAVSVYLCKLWFAVKFDAANNAINDLHVWLNRALLRKAFIFSDVNLARKASFNLAKARKLRMQDVAMFICCLPILNNLVKALLGPLRISQKDFDQ